MIINKLEIRRHMDGIEQTEIIFDRHFLINSKKNSRGKTTMIRFILYALGFNIPSTKDINMTNYICILNLNNGTDLVIERANNLFRMNYKDDGTIITYDFNKALDREKALSLVFNIDNVNLIDNILGAFYIDQEEGWKVLNRGKVIGGYHFIIEEFILALNNSSEIDFQLRLEQLNEEIDRYSKIQNVSKLRIDTNRQRKIYKQSNIEQDLLNRKNIIVFDIEEIDRRLIELEKVIRTNDSIVDFIEKSQLLIHYNNQHFVLKKEHIKDFSINQNIIKAELFSLKTEKKELEKELARVKYALNKNFTLVDLAPLSEEIIQSIKKVSFDEQQMSEYINELKKEEKRLKKERKAFIRNKELDITMHLLKEVKRFSEALSVFDKISNEEDYAFTRDLKSLSGAILHKLALSYKLAYVSAVDKFMSIKLPIIIDSPGSGEVTLENARMMIKTVVDNFGEHQIIVASVYADIAECFDKAIILSNGIFGISEYQHREVSRA